MSLLCSVLIGIVFLQTTTKGSYTCPASQPCTHSCTQASPCSANPYTIQCRNDQPCTIQCIGTNVCYEAIINCPINAECTVNCIGTTACAQLEVNAATNTVGVDVTCDDVNACWGATIHWPSDDTVHRSLTCDNTDTSCSQMVHDGSITTKPTAATTTAPTTTAPTTTAPTPTTTTATTATTATPITTTATPTTTTATATTTVPSTFPSVSPTEYPSASPTTSVPTVYPTTRSPTNRPTIAKTLHSEVAVSIGFEFTYNNDNNESMVDIKELLTDTTTEIINEGIVTVNIDCYSSDYMINIQIVNNNTAEINATILICNETKADQLAAYFRDILGQNNVIETKYEEDDVIDLKPETTTIVAISNEILKPEIIETTSTTKTAKTTEPFMLNEDDNKGGEDEDSVLIIIFSILSCIFCLIIIIAIIIFIRRNNKNYGIEMPIKPQRAQSHSITDPPKSTETKSNSDLNTANVRKGENDHNDDSDDDENDDIYGNDDDLASTPGQKTIGTDDGDVVPKSISTNDSEMVINGHEPGSISVNDRDSDIYKEPELDLDTADTIQCNV